MSCAEYGGESTPSFYPSSSRRKNGNSKNGHGTNTIGKGNGGNINGNGNSHVAENDGDINEFMTHNQGQPQEQPPCTFERELTKEMASYKNLAEGAYCPGPFNRAQLIKAALEFYKRWKESEEDFEKQQLKETEKSPFVLVAQNCSKIPSDDLTHSALQDLDDVDKLWYFLSDEGDLFITKLASGPAHGAAVVTLTSRMDIYVEQYEGHAGDAFAVVSDGILNLSGGAVANVGCRRGGRRAKGRAAPDGVLQRTHPANPRRMRSPLVVEVEHGNRGPKALMELLDLYLAQPHSMYVLGIKICKKQQSQQNANPAVAILWQRANAANAAHPVIGVWNFGTMSLPPSAIQAFCKGSGKLAKPTMNDFQYPPNNPIITIPDAVLVQGVQYTNGVPVQPNGNDLTIDLDRLLRKAQFFM